MDNNRPASTFALVIFLIVLLNNCPHHVSAQTDLTAALYSPAAISDSVPDFLTMMTTTTTITVTNSSSIETSTCLVTVTRFIEGKATSTKAWTPTPKATTVETSPSFGCNFPEYAIVEPKKILDFTDIGSSTEQFSKFLGTGSPNDVEYDGIPLSYFEPLYIVNCGLFTNGTEIQKSCHVPNYALFGNATSAGFLYIGTTSSTLFSTTWKNTFFTLSSLWLSSIQQPPGSFIYSPLSNITAEFSGFRYDGQRPKFKTTIQPPCGGGPTFVDGFEGKGFVNMLTLELRVRKEDGDDGAGEPLMFVVDDLEVVMKSLPSTEAYCLAV